MTGLLKRLGAVFCVGLAVLATALGPAQSLAGPIALRVISAQPETPVRVVSTNNRMGVVKVTPTTGQTMFQYRIPHQLGGPVREFRLAFYNWTMSTSNATTPAYEEYNTTDTAYAHVNLEVAGGQVVPVTVGGSTSWSVPGNVAMVLSDPIKVSTLGRGPSLPRDTVVWQRGEGTISAGAYYVGGSEAKYTGALAVTFDPANRIDQVGATGALSTPTGGTAQIYAPAGLVFGKFTRQGVPALVVVGDSIADGSADNPLLPSTVDGHGFVSRASVDTNGVNAIPILHVTKPGDSAYGWSVNSAFRRQFLKYGNVLFEEFVTNDFSSTGAGTGVGTNNAIALANSRMIWTLFRADGGERIIRSNLLPKTATQVITALTSSGTTATATVPSTAQFTVGQTLYISGATPAEYSGLYTVASVVSGTQLTYTFAGSASATATLSTAKAQGSYPGYNSAAALWNTQMDGELAAGSVDYILNIRSPLISADDATFFDGPKTADGTHPSSGASPNGSGLLAPPARTAFTSQPVSH